MKKSYKKYFGFAFLVGICTLSSVGASGLSEASVSASRDVHNWDGPALTTKYVNVNDIMEFDGVVKYQPVAASAVKWTKSQNSASHNLWFKVVGASDNISKGSVLVKEMNKSTGFSTSTEQGGTYKLYAKQEKTGYAGNESGIWTP